MADEPVMVKVRMAIVPVKNRQAIGPRSRTLYIFSPWAMVEERDVQDFLTLTVKSGCACTGNQRVQQMFATEDQILSGQIKPDWYVQEQRAKQRV